MTDYICTSDEISSIKSTMSLPEKTMLVHINDALLSNAEMRCLRHDDVFLHDDVSQTTQTLVIKHQCLKI